MSVRCILWGCPDDDGEEEDEEDDFLTLSLLGYPGAAA